MSAELKPIHSDAAYEKAISDVARLWGAKSGTREGDRLDILATLIEAYEAESFPMDPPDPIEAIKFRMEQQGLSRKDLEPLIGSRTRVAEVLNRKRGLSIAMIRRLHQELGIAADVLMRPAKDALPTCLRRFWASAHLTGSLYKCGRRTRIRSGELWWPA